MGDEANNTKSNANVLNQNKSRRISTFIASVLRRSEQTPTGTLFPRINPIRFKPSAVAIADIYPDETLVTDVG